MEGNVYFLLFFPFLIFPTEKLEIGTVLERETSYEMIFRISEMLLSNKVA